MADEIDHDLAATTAATTRLTSTASKGLAIGLGNADGDDAGTVDDVD